MGQIGCPKILVSNYQYSLPNKLLERSFHLPHDGSLKSSVAHIYREAILRYERRIRNDKLLSSLSILRCRVQNTYRLSWPRVFRAFVVRFKANSRAWQAKSEHGPHSLQAWWLHLTAWSSRVLQTGLIWVPKPKNIPAHVMPHIEVYCLFRKWSSFCPCRVHQQRRETRYPKRNPSCSSTCLLLSSAIR
jgi:hypothetical protein